MPELTIDDIATKGVTRDIPAYQLPPEFWSTALNMRSEDGAMVKMLGWTQVFGTPGVAPHFAMSVEGPSAAFWLYTSLTKAYGYDGVTHTNITRQSASVDVDYTPAETRHWNGTLFGGIPIVNSGADVPQFWGTIALATKLANLTNWDSTHRCKVMRSLGAYLIAIHVTKGSTIYPHMVKWSSESTGPGVLPTSWDETDETKDAGEYDLPDVNAGLLRDALPLGGTMYLYKDAATWLMRFVGGRSVFKIDTYLETSGILAPRCVTVTGDGRFQVVATQDDLIMHNGGQPASILDKKLRKEIFASIDSANYLNSFVFTDPEKAEVLFCFPENGIVNPNRAVVFNYKTGAVTESDGITFRNASLGRFEVVDSETWADGTDTWEEPTGPWNTQERRRIVLCGTDDSKFFKLNDGNLRNGDSFLGTLQRTGLSMIGRKRNGDWIVDHQVEKVVDRLWPKIRGGGVQVRIGYADVVDGAVTWGAYRDFDPTAEVFVDPDPPVSGRAIAVEFRSTNDWKLDGYKINLNTVGQH